MIDECGREGDTLGGIVEVRVEGLPFGLGTHAQWDRKLDGRLAQAVMSMQAIKGVEIGLGLRSGPAARFAGSRSDSITIPSKPIRRTWATSARRTTPAAWKPA